MRTLGPNTRYALLSIVLLACLAGTPGEVGAGPARDAGRETVCTQPGILSSEKFPADTVEVANDCSGAGEGTIVHVTWWGGYLNWQPGDPEITLFDVAFYADDGGLPGSALVSYGSATPDTTRLGPCDDGLPCFRYEMDVEVPVGVDPFWFSVRAIVPPPLTALPDPPKWGRLGDEIFGGFASMYRPDAYHAWIALPTCEHCDASQEFEIERPTPARPSTWGAIRMLYRERPPVTAARARASHPPAHGANGD